MKIERLFISPDIIIFVVNSAGYMYLINEYIIL